MPSLKKEMKMKYAYVLEYYILQNRMKINMHYIVLIVLDVVKI